MKSQRPGWVCRVSDPAFSLDLAVDCPRTTKINFDAPKGTLPGERANCDIGVYGAPEGQELRLIGGVTAQTYVPVPCGMIGVIVDENGSPVPNAKLTFVVAPTEKESPSHQNIPITTAIPNQFGNFSATLTPDVQRLISIEAKVGKGQVLVIPRCGQPMRFVISRVA